MADVTKITLPNGTTKDIKDATARAQANWNTNNGVKNLLNFGEDRTVSGSGSLKYTLSNGVVTVNGTPTSDDYFNLEFTGISGEMVLTGCPSNGSNSTYLQRIFSTDGTVAAAYDYGNGSDVYNYNANVSYRFSIKIKSGYTANNLVFRPMLRPAFITDTTFEPYSLPNTKITPELIELVDSGVKNISTFETGTNSNVNKWVTGSGGTDVTCNLLAGKTYIISFTTNYSGSTAQGQLSCKATDNTDINSPAIAISASCIITFTPAKDLKSFGVYINEGAVTVTNFMICSKAAWDVSQKYVPYSMSNAELTSDVSWNKTTLQFSATVADTYEYTGLSVSCPANTLLEIWAIDDNSNSRITAIAVTDSNTSIDTVGAVIGENAEPLTMVASAQWAREVHCVTPRLYNSVRTYYVWVKRGSTGANNVTLLTRKIVTH